ncbi:MAG: tetratricopeptide repeat protein [Planctomycetota bacterium]
MRRFGMTCGLLVLACGLVAGDGELFSNALTLRLPCTVRSGPAGIKEVEIWSTVDSGTTWERAAVITDAAVALTVTVAVDGVYGFRTVVVGNNGKREAAPKTGDAPQLVYTIDTHAPVIKLLASAAGTTIKPGESVEVSWEISDPNLDPEATNVLFSDDGGGNWKIISEPGSMAGRHTVVGSVYVTPAVFKVAAGDRAGNRSVQVMAFSVAGEGAAAVPAAAPAGAPAPAPGTPAPAAAEVTEPARPPAPAGPAATAPASDGSQETLTIISAPGKEGFETIIEVESGYVAETAARDEGPAAGEMVILQEGERQIPTRRPEPAAPARPAATPAAPAAESAPAVPAREAVDGAAVAECDRAIEAEIFGNAEAAAKLYVNALKREPKYYRARKGLADLCLREGQYKAARQQYEAILQVNPDDVISRVNAAFCAYRLGDAAGAEREYKRILALNPGSVDCMWYLSKIYKDRAMMKDATYLWIRIVNTGPDDNKWFDFARNYLAIYAGRT